MSVQSVTIVLRTAEGATAPIALPTGESLMHALRASGASIRSICGGRAICGMCRVGVEPGCAALAPATPNERRLLDILPGGTPHHRLACQIRLSPEHEGLAVRIDEPPSRRSLLPSPPPKESKT